MLYRLKDIAVAMDCHEKTAKRWYKALRVFPDIVGHGANRWREASFQKLMTLWAGVYSARGTTPQITRKKFAGVLTDKNQLSLPFPDGKKSNAGKTRN